MATLSLDKKIVLQQGFNRALVQAGVNEGSLDFSWFEYFESATQAPINLFVDAVAGKDTNSGSQTSPFATIQAALDSVPTLIKHPVIITVGAGNFPGFLFGGQEITATGTLLVRGTHVAATLASGAAGGTVTSATAGSVLISGWATLTLSGAGWTSSDLRGKWVRILTGPGAGQVRAIYDNTATTLTITGAWTTVPTNSSTFDIVVPGTVITSSVTYPASLEGKGLSPSSNSGGAVVMYGGPTGGLSLFTAVAETRRAIQNLKVANGVGAIVVTGATLSGIYGVWLDDATSGIAVTELGDAVVQETVSTRAGQTFITNTTGLRATVQNCVASGVATAFFVQGGPRFNISQSAFLSLTSAFLNYSAGAPGSFNVVTSILTGNGSSNGFKKNGAASLGGGHWALTFSSLSSFATALELQGPMVVQLTSVSGSGNTTALTLTKGAKVAVDSGSTITGTTEITIDGAAATTLAAMRAANPKVLPAVVSPYGTAIFE